MPTILITPTQTQDTGLQATVGYPPVAQVDEETADLPLLAAAIAGIAQDSGNAGLCNCGAPHAWPGKAAFDHRRAEHTACIANFDLGNYGLEPVGNGEKRMVSAFGVPVGLHGPEEPHSVYALVGAGNRSLRLDIDHALRPGVENRLAPPPVLVLRPRLSLHGNQMVRWQPGHGDGELVIHQRLGRADR